MKQIRDPLYGYIDVSDAELDVLNSEPVQRLRRVKQLGLSLTVYPGATHTRFEHSLGVMHLAGRVARSLDLSEPEVQANRLAGLLHDSGHLPFSHTLEEIMQEEQGYGHEEISCKIVDELAEDRTVRFPADVHRVKDMIRGEYDGVNLIANEIDVDRLDYLQRDSYETGIEHGAIDADTLIKFSSIIDGEFGFEYKALQSVESLLSSRLHMTRSVYSHDTVNVTETMLKRAVQAYLFETNKQMSDFIKLDDGLLRAELQNTNVELTDELFSRVIDRHLYKESLSYVFDSESGETIKSIADSLDNPQVHEVAIAQKANVPRKAVLINPPTYKEMDKFSVPVRDKSGTVRQLEEVSSMVEALHDLSCRSVELSVYAPPEYVNNVNEAAKEYFTGHLEQLAEIFSQ